MRKTHKQTELKTKYTCELDLLNKGSIKLLTVFPLSSHALQPLSSSLIVFFSLDLITIASEPHQDSFYVFVLLIIEFLSA